MAGIGMAIVATDGRLVEVNPALCEILGYRADQLCALTFQAITHPDDLEADLAFTAALLAGEIPSFQMEKRYIHQRGHFVWAQLTGSVVRDADGEPLHFIGQVQDIDVRKRAEATLQTTQEELRRSEEHWRTLIANSSDIITIFGPDGTIRYESPSVERVLGFRQDELLGRSVLDFVHPDDARRISHTFATVLHRPGVAPPIDVRFRHRDGSWRHFESVGNHVRDETGALSIVVNSRDVTERRQIEVELARAKDSAEAANRAKSEFLANMSHEIRTPLNGVIGITQLLSDTALSSEQHEYLELINVSAGALLAIINDVLDFSKIEAGKLTLDDEAFALRACLDDAVRVQAVRAQQKGLTFTCSIAADVPDRIGGDAVRLQQLLVNLISNAVKFTAQGSIAVSVECDRTAPSHGGSTALLFAVRDTGIGIPPGKQQAVFEAFEQADGSMTRHFGGTGLGLAICKRLVEMMGGRLWVDSLEGAGSTFYFTARFGLPATAAGEAVGPTDAPAAAHADAPRHLRVLLAEDNRVNQRLAMRMLEKRGCTVVVADNGAEAVAAVAQGGFDLVLMDVQMPVMCGFEATAAIRAQGVSVPIIALTAHALKGDEERCLAAGMDAYVSKPIRAALLFDAIDRALSDAQARR